jgi:hypothetical protein
LEDFGRPVRRIGGVGWNAMLHGFEKYGIIAAEANLV